MAKGWLLVSHEKIDANVGYETVDGRKNLNLFGRLDHNHYAINEGRGCKAPTAADKG
jgi:hypothetical protein